VRHADAPTRLFASEDSDDEEGGAVVHARLTPAQARRELDELEEFKTLGLLSNKEYVAKKAALTAMLGAGGAPPSNGAGGGGASSAAAKIRASEQLDSLLAELGDD
jgi:hypothetical protein